MGVFHRIIVAHLRPEKTIRSWVISGLPRFNGTGELSQGETRLAIGAS
jgi:hypothetical protein